MIDLHVSVHVAFVLFGVLSVIANFVQAYVGYNQEKTIDALKEHASKEFNAKIHTYTNRQQFKAVCATWDGSMEGFQEIIQLLPTGEYADLADECEVSYSTVERWARGTSCPMPGTMRMIVQKLLLEF